MAEDSVRIHPTAQVSPTAIIGSGTSIWHHCGVRERAQIGRSCILGKGVYVDFDATILMVGHREYRTLDLLKLHKSLRAPMLIDGRHFIDKTGTKDAGLIY